MPTFVCVTVGIKIRLAWDSSLLTCSDELNRYNQLWDYWIIFPTKMRISPSQIRCGISDAILIIANYERCRTMNELSVILRRYVTNFCRRFTKKISKIILSRWLRSFHQIKAQLSNYDKLMRLMRMKIRHVKAT